MKHLFYLLILIILLGACKNKKELLPDYYKVSGYAQGTTYNIIYRDSLQRDLSVQFDSVLTHFDGELSIYVDTSTISKVNQLAVGDSLDVSNSPLFVQCFTAAKTIYENTNGAFNPAVYPLVKYWGFLNFEKADTSFSQHEIDSILQCIDFSDKALRIEKTGTQNYLKKYKNSVIDFNAIAQGYSVDVIADFLETLGIYNYMVEVGGELKTKGVNNKNKVWKIGIDRPVEHSAPGEQFQKIVKLNNLALATSGNYRKFYEKDGVKYSHTIDPITGKPVTHQLLSTTVITDNCALADGYATAFMVMGTEKTKVFLEHNKQLDLGVFLIFNDSTSNYKTWKNEVFIDIVEQK